MIESPCAVNHMPAVVMLCSQYQFDKCLLLTLRFEREGDCGEFVWLQKGDLLADRTILTLCLLFINYLSLRSCYLLDSSQILCYDVICAVNERINYTLFLASDSGLKSVGNKLGMSIYVVFGEF